MVKDKRLFYCKPLPSREAVNSEVKSAAEMIQDLVKPASVVSAFQTVPAMYLSRIDSNLNIDVLIASDDESATTIVQTWCTISLTLSLESWSIGELEMH